MAEVQVTQGEKQAVAERAPPSKYPATGAQVVPLSYLFKPATQERQVLAPAPLQVVHVPKHGKHPLPFVLT